MDRDLKYITATVHLDDLARSQLTVGDVLMTITGRVGSAAVVCNEHLPANINQHIARLRINAAHCRPEFLSEWLNCPAGQELSNRFVSGGTRAALDYGAIRNIRIPLPSLPEQDRLLEAMDAARDERKAKLAAADALLAGVDDYVLNALGLTAPQADTRHIFAIQTKELGSAINPERYRGLQIEKRIPFQNTVGDMGVLLKNKISPAKEAPEEEFDWIRIDDLSNRPWGIEQVRTERGENITGTFFEVQEDDILIARLGPTIKNSKFVLCPKLAHRTIASTEFLVLRCHRDHEPDAVLWILRTALYREVMYSRSRGATPSRFRLTGDDLLSIPFPRVDLDVQSAIAAELSRRRREARRLRAEAEAGWQAARRWFEGALLGEYESL